MCPAAGGSPVLAPSVVSSQCGSPSLYELSKYGKKDSVCTLYSVSGCTACTACTVLQPAAHSDDKGGAKYTNILLTGGPHNVVFGTLYLGQLAPSVLAW